MRLIKYGFFLLLFISLSASADFAPAHKQSGQPARNISLLFVQQANALRFVPTQKGCYRLILSGIRDNMLYFSDRPNRVVGYISNKEFFAMWKKAKIHPNTAVHGFISKNSSKNAVTEVLTFQRPSHINTRTGEITYHACVTDANSGNKVKYNKLYNVSLFVDDMSYWVN